MDHFHYRNRILHCEDVPVRQLAEKYGTPLYVYSKATLLHHLQQLQKAFAAVEPLICYSIKTNGNLHICRLDGRARLRLRRHQRRRAVSRPQSRRPRRQDRLRRRRQDRCRDAHGLENNVFLFNVESEGELHALADVAEACRQGGRRWPCASIPICRPRRTPRPIPASRASSSASTSTPSSTSPRTWSAIRTSSVIGLHMHLGSPILSTQPYREGVAKGLVLIEQLREQGHPISVSEHGRRLRHPLSQAGSAAGQRVRRGHRAGRAEGEVQAGARTGPLHRRQRRHPGQPRVFTRRSRAASTSSSRMPP